MNSIIFILAIASTEHCRVPLADGPFGKLCPGANFAWTKTYTVNNHPCLDLGMDREISEQELHKYKKVYEVIQQPSGGISYCPETNRYRRRSLSELPRNT